MSCTVIITVINIKGGVLTIKREWRKMKIYDNMQHTHTHTHKHTHILLDHKPVGALH